jgi:hypothetical protein
LPRDIDIVVPPAQRYTVPLAESGLFQVLFAFSMGCLALFGVLLAGGAEDGYARFAGLLFMAFAGLTSVRYFARRG